MAKDPAFLFYPGDWISGTMTMTRHQKGCYVDLLCAQFNSGPLSLEAIKTVLGNDFAVWGSISRKFKQDENGLFFNERLVSEMIKRSNFNKKQFDNGSKGGRPKKPKKNPNDNPNQNPKYNPNKTLLENENRNRNLNENSFEKGSEKTFPDPGKMGFKGRCRKYMAENHPTYIWTEIDDIAIDSLKWKIKQLHTASNRPTEPEDLTGTFQYLLENLSGWVRENKFSLNYINDKFNEIVTSAITKPKNINGKRKGDAPISQEDEARLKQLLASGELLGID